MARHGPARQTARDRIDRTARGDVAYSSTRWPNHSATAGSSSGLQNTYT